MEIDAKYLDKMLEMSELGFKLFKVTKTDIRILNELNSTNDGKTLAAIFHGLEADSRSNVQKVIDKLRRYDLIIKDVDVDEDTGENFIYRITERGEHYLRCVILINKYKLNTNDQYSKKSNKDDINKDDSLNAVVEYYAGGKRIHKFVSKKEFQNHLEEVNRINAYEENYYLLKPVNGSPKIHTLGDLRKKGIDDVSVLLTIINQ